MAPERVIEVELATEWNRFRGRMLGFIEACGLTPSQEAGMKQLTKSLTYDAEERIKRAISEPRPE